MRRLFFAFIGSVFLLAGQRSPDQVAALRADLTGDIERSKKQTQVMIDSVFSFAELGFQEVETSRYLTAILEKEGFQVERGIAGIAYRLDGFMGIG